MIKKTLVIITILTASIIFLGSAIEYVFFSLSTKVEGKKEDDWRIKWNVFMSNDLLISNHPLFSNKQRPTYYFSPLQWNSDGIELIEYTSCLPELELNKKYKGVMSKYGEWQKKTSLNYRNNKTLRFNKTQVDNNLNINRLLSIESLENGCFNVVYSRTTSE